MFSVVMVFIVLRGLYGRITKNDRCLIKTIKTENITDKHNMTLIVSSQSDKALLWISKQVRNKYYWTVLGKF